MNVVQIMVRPGDGRRVRMPDGRMLVGGKVPAAGVSVPLNNYVRRRLACGDLVEISSQSPASSSQKPAAAPSNLKTDS